MIAAATSEDPECARIDISKVRFVDPFGLVTLAVLAEDAALARTGLDIRWPRSPDIRRYLSRMHLPAALEELGFECPLAAVNEQPLGDRVLELTRFEGADRGSELAEKVYDILSGDDPDDAKTLYQCVSEAVENVCEHSGNDGGWAALQQYRRGGRNEVVFAVADSGVGLRRTLLRHYSVPGDKRAIELAVQAGVSGTGDQARGRGLAGIVGKAHARGGFLALWSGHAAGRTDPRRSSPNLTDAATYPGTVISATLSY